MNIIATSGRAVIQSPPRCPAFALRATARQACPERHVQASRRRYHAHMTLPKRPLGTSGMNLTTVGFGAWAAGGGGWSFSWGPQDDQTSIATMRHAIDQGVN